MAISATADFTVVYCVTFLKKSLAVSLGIDVWVTINLLNATKKQASD